MKRLMFYCQHILGMGHLVRSMEIVRGLVKDFQICFINGGEVVSNFEIPAEIEVINLPGIKTDPEFRMLQTVDSSQDLAEVQAIRAGQLLQVFDRFKPDILMIELFPFGRRKFSFELIPLLERVRAKGRKTKVVCSLRDIVVTKQNQEKHEEKVCTLMNQYFDLLLVHGDRHFQPLEETFSRTADLRCKVHYTGYVVQPPPQQKLPTELPQPLILVSVGGGRFGHELLHCMADVAPLLADRIPHQIQIFAGPFAPDELITALRTKAARSANLQVDRYTPNLLNYMNVADLSISMSGYNTTMNILTTGVKAMILPFTGNDDQEQTIRSQKLEDLGVVEVIRPEDLTPEVFAEHIIRCLQRPFTRVAFDFDGVHQTAECLRQLMTIQVA